DAFQNPHRGLGAVLGRGRCLGGKTIAHQPTRPALKVEIARSPAGVEYLLDQRSGAGAIASAEMALGEPRGLVEVSVAQIGTGEPGDCFAQFRHTGVDPARLDFSVPADPFGHHGVAWDGCECKRFVATLQSKFEIALLDIGRSHPQPSDRLDRLKTKFREGDAVLQPAATIIHAGIPLAESICRYTQKPERPGGPPPIAARLKARKGTFACLDRIARLAGNDIDLGQG